MNDHLLRELMAQAQYYADHSMWLHAVQPYQRILEEVPDLLPVRVKLAETYIAMNQHDAAERLLLSELKDGESNSDVLFTLGMLFFHLPDPSRAIFYLEKLSADPTPRVLHALGLLYLRMGSYRNAITQLARCLDMDADNSEASHALARACLLAGEFEQASDVANAAIGKNPRDGMALYLAGCGHEYGRRWAEARSAYAGALHERPGDFELLVAASRVAIQLGEFEQAEEFLRRAADIEPASSVPQKMLGDLAVRRAEPGKAQQYFRRALELDPENTDAELNLRVLDPLGHPADTFPPA